MADNKGFMGRGFSFPFRVDPSTNRIAMSSAGQDVEEAIRIILRTNLGERRRLMTISQRLKKASAKRLSNGSRVSWISTCRQRAKARGEC